VTALVELRASTIGDLAAALLQDEPQWARVHSVFPHAVNIAFGKDGWVCLHPDGGPLNPYSVVLRGEGAEGGGGGGRALLGARQGEPAFVSRRRLELVCPAVAISLETARVWDSAIRPWTSTGRGAVGRRAVVRWAAPEGEASVFLRSVTCRRGREVPGARVALDGTPSEHLAGLIGDRVNAALGVLARALLARDPVGLDVALRDIVGLGTGFTPAGDDFLVGLLAASRSTIPEETCDLACRVDRLLASVPGATTQASCLMLKAAAAGHYPEALIELVTALASGDAGSVRLSAGRLASLGATSGQDVLAGVLFWLDTCREGAGERA
jgi:hypothetical protein